MKEEDDILRLALLQSMKYSDIREHHCPIGLFRLSQAVSAARVLKIGHLHLP